DAETGRVTVTSTPEQTTRPSRPSKASGLGLAQRAPRPGRTTGSLIEADPRGQPGPRSIGAHRGRIRAFAQRYPINSVDAANESGRVGNEHGTAPRRCSGPPAVAAVSGKIGGCGA